MPHIGNFPYGIFPKPLSIGPSAFVPETDTQDWLIRGTYIQNRAALGLQEFSAAVYLPQGARVTKLTLYGYRDDGLAQLLLQLARSSSAGVVTDMASVEADWTTGDSSGYDDTITDPVIDNENYSYHLVVTLTPNDAVNDIRFRRAQIDWT